MPKADEGLRQCFVVVALALIVSTASAQTITVTEHGTVVAHDGRIELFDSAMQRVWSADGVDHDSLLVTSRDQIAVVDALDNEARIVDTRSGRGTLVRTGETPVAGLFVDRELYLLTRDTRTLERIGANGSRQSVAVAADPAFLGRSGDRLFVYSRLEGVLQEISIARFEETRTTRVEPFAADMELAGDNLYLLHPRDAKVRAYSMKTLKPSGTIDVGAVPSDLALSGRTVAVADPSAKRVWVVEGVQSFGQAFMRGFARGLIGLGLFSDRESRFPTGVDRVLMRGSSGLAYDSSSRTLYRFTKSQSSVLARDIAPRAFALTAEGAVWWDGRRLSRTGPAVAPERPRDD